MKDIKSYIQEGFFTNINATDYFDRSFDTIEEFAEVCNIVFKDQLDKPIKINGSEASWSHASLAYPRDGIYVRKHFTMSFNGGKKRLRVGVHDGMLMMQKLFKDYKGSTQYTWMTAYFYSKTSDRCGYKLGNGINFKEWVKSRHRDYDYLRKLFIEHL